MNYKKAMNKMVAKTTIFIFLILALACVFTYKIYYQFVGQRDKIRNSPSLEVTYHGKYGEEVNFTKITPVTDSVGLSSNPHKITIKNSTTKKVKYKIVVVPNKDKYLEEDCGEYKIPDNIIKVGIHPRGKVSEIYNLDDLDGNILETAVLSPQSSVDYTIRFWVSQNTLIQDADMHFHGIIEVVEE